MFNCSYSVEELAQSTSMYGVLFSIHIVLHEIMLIYSYDRRYDSRVKAMEVDERPTEQYADIGGLDKQIQEV